jgi:hypothetical protein
LHFHIDRPWRLDRIRRIRWAELPDYGRLESFSQKAMKV